MVFRGADVGVDVVGLARLATPATPVMGGGGVSMLWQVMLGKRWA